MGHGAHAHAGLPGGLLLPHAAQYQFDRLPPGFHGDDGAPHMPGMTGILRQPAFQALPGRITETFGHFVGRHRCRETEFHRPLAFLGTEHNQILSFGLQENVRSPTGM